MKACFLLWVLVCPLLLGQDREGSIVIDSRGFTTNEQQQNVLIDVTVRVEDMFLMTADEMILDRAAGTVTVRGNVKLDYQIEAGLIEVVAQEGFFHYDGSAGYFTDVSARFGDDFFFVGARLEVLDSGELILIEDGTATSCNQVRSQWSLSLKRARVRREGYAVVRGFQFRILDVPIFYLPWMIAPAMQERRSGLLFPDTGGSERNGAFFSQPIYWAPRQDWDATFIPSFHTDAGFQMGVEARYATRPDLGGILKGSWFRDRVMQRLRAEGTAPLEDGKPLEEDRFRIDFRHGQRTMGGNLRIDIDGGSDFSVDRDYLENADATRIRDYTYRASWDRPIRRNAVFLRLNRLERILAVDERVTEVNQLPEMRLYMPNRHIGSGFFLRNYFYGDWYDYQDLQTAPDATPIEGELFRLGIDSELSRTLAQTGLVRVRWGVRYQGAYYNQSGVEEDAELRGGAFGFIETTGPRFSRTYRAGEKRLVHYIDGGLSIKGGDRQEDPFLESVFFDELDIRLNEQVDGLQTGWRVSSRLFAGPKGRVRPFMDIAISQDANIDSDLENSPIETRVRLLNLGGFHANSVFDYNPDTASFDTLSVYGSINRPSWLGYGGYVRRRAAGDIRQESFVGILQWRLESIRSRFKAALDYNFETSELKSQELLYGYEGQCLGITLEYVKSPFDSSVTGTRDFVRISFNFRNLANNIGSRL